jgi:hypothetical protein
MTRAPTEAPPNKTPAGATDVLKFHVSLNVSDLPRSLAFYTALLGQGPVKVYENYAKFELNEPPLVLSLKPHAARKGGPLNHLGLRVRTPEELHPDPGLPSVRKGGVAMFAIHLVAAVISEHAQEPNRGKALSTGKLRRAVSLQLPVPRSEMPKGVEQNAVDHHAHAGVSSAEVRVAEMLAAQNAQPCKRFRPPVLPRARLHALETAENTPR